MGRANAVTAMVTWRALDSMPMRLLVHMALMSLDPPGSDEIDPCLYFAGWETQALALGMDVPPAAATDTWSVERRRVIQRAVARHREILAVAGAISRVKHSAPGRPAAWRVHPDPPDPDR
jgi:hypothetical protein